MKDEPKASENGHEAMHTSTDLHGRDFATLTQLELNCFAGPAYRRPKIWPDRER